ncbi:MAG: hypothetical protein IT288_00285 [Bdellovibrionales bacterium]|nr:hypothetical protein [Bdellovibrionales bacterium]
MVTVRMKAQLSLGTVFALLLVALVGGCSKGVKEKTSIDSAMVKAEDQEQRLLEMLTRSQNLAGELRALVTDKDGVDNPFGKLADNLDATRKRILDLIQARKMPVHHPEVLAQVDYLILLISDGGDLKLERRIDKLEEEARARFLALEKNLQDLKADLKNFEEQVNKRFAAIDNDIKGLKERDKELEALILQVQSSSLAATQALQNAFKELKEYTSKEIANLYKVSASLKQQLEKQYKEFDELLKAQKQVDNLQAKMCSVDNTGTVNDPRLVCTGAETDLDASNCCLTIEKVQCGVLFPQDNQLPARNQCQIIISTLKNHQAQLAAIREVDVKQSELIKGILGNIEDLRKQDEVLAKGLELITITLEKVVDKISAMDHDIMILKFKAARAEAAASLQERADLNLAWLARRSSDVHERFCQKNIHASLNSFDYKAARQNWDYCRERMEWIVQAKEMVQVAKAYINGLESLNVDIRCTATIRGKTAEALSNRELADTEVFREVNDNCMGGPVLARAKMINVLKLLDSVGPDFRTAGYMAKKAEIAQLLAFGKLVSQTSLAERKAFENVDPTSADVASTYYGRIERVFRKRYVESKMRTLAGQFPEDATTIPGAIAGFDEVFSHAELAKGDSAVAQSVKPFEVSGSCGDCGWKVDGRQTTERVSGANVRTSRDGKKRFAFPQDPEPLCPIIEDVVGIEGKDGKIYAYNLSYEWIWERLTPVIWSGGQVVLAQSRTDAQAGTFRRATYKHNFLLDRVGLPLARLEANTVVRVSSPYGKTYAGRGHCKAFRLVNVAREDNQFKAPSSEDHNYTRYLTGLDQTVLLNECKKSITNPKVVTTTLDRNASDPVLRTRSLEILNDLIVFQAPAEADPVRAQILSSLNDQTTQLGANYWVLKARDHQGRAVPVRYGVDNLELSEFNPFYASHQSHGDILIRHVRTSPGPLAFQECRAQ